MRFAAGALDEGEHLLARRVDQSIVIEEPQTGLFGQIPTRLARIPQSPLDLDGADQRLET